MNPRIARFYLLSLFVALCASPAFAQFGDLGDKLKKKAPNLLGGKAPITTSLSDAKWEDDTKTALPLVKNLVR